MGIVCVEAGDLGALLELSYQRFIERLVMRILLGRRVAASILVVMALLRMDSAVADPPSRSLPMEVTVTRQPELVDDVPASISLVTGAELEARGARDLRAALAGVAGVEGTAGGDVGPAGSVPALWGLREADAFLLVVDGVPWGGAFNPATASVDLTNVERIEVLRGAAPVMFGATSFVGVIHVIHRSAAETPRTGALSVGTGGSYLASASTRLPDVGAWHQALTADVEHRGYTEDRTDWRRAHALYRGEGLYGETRVRVDLDLSSVPQSPAGNLLLADAGVLHPEFSSDVNFNPADAHLRGERYHGVVAVDGRSAWGDWGLTLAVTRSLDNILRGYLRGDAFALPPDAGVGDGLQADGYSQTRGITDIYFDAHLVHAFSGGSLTIGASHLHGAGSEHAINFGYCVDARGIEIPCEGAHHADEIVQSRNTRDFSGLYAQGDWAVGPLDLVAGVRLDHTRERASGIAIDNTGETPLVVFDGSDRGNNTRLTGSLGGSWHVWRAAQDALTLYTDARSSFKPLATDFGPEAEVAVLKPETGRSLELGLKSRLAGGRIEVDASVFRMTLANGLTYAETAQGYGPSNGGENRYQGAELEAHFRVGTQWFIDAHVAHHDARVLSRADEAGVNLSGKQVAMSPATLAGTSLRWDDAAGHSVALGASFSGDRWLDPENTLEAPSYMTWDAQATWPVGRGRLRLRGTNLTDRRDPVSTSELQHAVTVTGTSGWYRVPSRQILLGIEWPW